MNTKHQMLKAIAFSTLFSGFCFILPPVYAQAKAQKPRRSARSPEPCSPSASPPTTPVDTPLGKAVRPARKGAVARALKAAAPELADCAGKSKKPKAPLPAAPPRKHESLAVQAGKLKAKAVFLPEGLEKALFARAGDLMLAASIEDLRRDVIKAHRLMIAARLHQASGYKLGALRLASDLESLCPEAGRHHLVACLIFTCLELIFSHPELIAPTRESSVFERVSVPGLAEADAHTVRRHLAGKDWCQMFELAFDVQTRAIELAKAAVGAPDDFAPLAESLCGPPHPLEPVTACDLDDADLGGLLAAAPRTFCCATPPPTPFCPTPCCSSPPPWGLSDGCGTPPPCLPVLEAF